VKSISRFDSDIHHRRSIRLKGYDYSQPGAYFVTIASYQREPLFGEIQEFSMFLNQYGKTVHNYWDRIPGHYSNISLDAFIVMPNHIHGIIIIDDVGAGLKPAPTERYPLYEIIRAFKTFSARQINKMRGAPGIPVWQRNYFERIIRDEKELDSIREYINNNINAWELNKEWV